MKKIYFLTISLIANLMISSVAEAKPYSRASSFRGPLKSEEIIHFKKKKIEARAPNEIKLLVWNIFLCQKKKWEETFKEVSSHYNLVMLQEFLMTDKAKSVFQSDNLDYYFGTAYVLKKGDVLSGVATASLFKTYDHSTLYTKDFEPILNVHKTSLISYTTLSDGKKMLVVNTHAINFVVDNIFMKQIDDLMKILKNFKGPIIFAGDFNTFSYGKLKYLKHEAEKIGLSEVEFTNDENRKRFLKYPLDHCFYKGLKLKEAKVLNVLEGSDHNALHIVFTY